MNKLFLLDAYALIFRAYYAFINRPIRNAKGLNTSAIFGFVSSLDEILRKEKPSHIAVAFDPPTLTFRHEIFTDYKANRSETPEDIRLSVPYIKKILNAYNIPVLEYNGFEADDVIGTMAKLAKNSGFEVFMMTPDKDFAQLVEDGIYIYKPRRSGNDIEIWGVDEVKRNFEIADPIQVIDVLALWGDASDNIPGAPGFGEKTAKKLIAEFGSVENLLENTDKLSKKHKETLHLFRDQVLLSKKLATIDINVPINVNVNDLICKNPDKELLGAIFSELEFRTLSQRILKPSVANVPPVQGSLFAIPDQTDQTEYIQSLKGFDPQLVKYSLIKSDLELNDLISALQSRQEICFDTETTGLNVLEAEIVGLAISFNECEAFYVPFERDQQKSEKILSRFQDIFENESIKKIGHNIKFDAEILARYGISLKGACFDTMVANYLINPERKNKLDNLAENMLNYKMIPIEDLIGKKGKDQLNMCNIPLETVKDYACEDADITFRLYNLLKEKIKEQGLQNLCDSIEMPLIYVLMDIEMAGFNLDIKALKDFELQLQKDIIQIEDSIYNMAGEKFNVSSPKQLGVILFEKLKVTDNIKFTKTKQYSTGEDILQQLIGSHPIINAILDYRGLTKLQSTYVKALPELINYRTKRIHTSFNQTIAATGRLSSINPNLQNIPIREETGREIRKAFIAGGNDFFVLSADYSQIELRLMAHMSGDPQMISAFANGEDIHQSTAAKIFKISAEEVTREMRSKAKTANFGIIYGISAFGLSQRLNIPRSEAKVLIDSYFENFPLIKQYMDHSIEKAKSTGFVTTLFGRKRFLPDINSSNSVVRGVAERNAINSPIQGTASDIIKIAMISIHRKLKNYKSKMILQVHDELVFDVYKPELDAIKNIVRSEMENAVQLSIPLLVEIGFGSNWLEAHT
jgi:DNA polymerase-1